MGSKRIIEVDVLRGIAAIMMIIGHSILRYPVNISEIPWCKALESFIFSFHMELFFVLAGYVYKCLSYSQYVKRKVIRIIIPYFVFGIPNALFHVWGGSFVNGTGNLKDELQKIFFYGGEYWFLYTIFIIYLVFPLVEKMQSDKLILVLLGFSLILADLINVKLFCIQLVLYHLPYFGIGYLVKKHSNEKISSLCVLNSTRSILLFVESTLLYVILCILYNYYCLSIVRYFRALSLIIALFIAVTLFVKKWRLQLERGIIKKCSEYSLQIYVFNGYLLVIYRVLICQVFSVTNPVIILVALPILIISTSLLLCALFSKLRWASLLIGIRSKEINVIK